MNEVTSTAPAVRPGPRERLLGAARDLTYRQGMSIGVDAILTQADVARRSLYQHFGGKDGLITEVIRLAAQDDERVYRQALADGGDDPRARLESMFEQLDRTISKPGFHGCRYLAADLALVDPEHPVHAETSAYRARLQNIFEDEIRSLGHPDPLRAAVELLLLVEGALVAGALRPETHPARTARALAEHVFKEAP